MIPLEPRNIKERMLKRQQQNKKLLMENEVLDIDYILEIDESWDFYLDSKYIKCKKIIGNIWLRLNHIPEWFSNIEIDGDFYCSHCNLITLKNCPKIIHGTFWCGNNNITSLEDGPSFVGGSYWCHGNVVYFTDEYIRSICIVEKAIFIIKKHDRLK